MPQAAPVHGRPRGRRLERNRQRRRELPTNSTAWRKIRSAVLTEQPLCVICAERGRRTPATQVDHIDGDAFNNAWDNLQALCHSCHSRKTVLEDGGLGRGD